MLRGNLSKKKAAARASKTNKATRASTNIGEDLQQKVVLSREEFESLKQQTLTNAEEKEKREATKRLYTLKIDSFTPTLPIVEKYGAWLDYAEKLKKQLKPCCLAGQAMMATVVYGAIGQELTEIINMKRLFPDETEVVQDYAFFDEMLKGIEQYLKSLSDDSMNMNHLLNMKQSPGESANDYLVRLHRQAGVCGMARDEFIRTRFLEGLGDRSLSDVAYQQGWTLDAILHAATRGETIVKKRNDCQAVEEIANISDTKRGRFGVKRRSTTGSWSDFKKPRVSGETQQRCQKCNRRFHKDGVCPAVDRSCRRCNQKGHFEAVCKEKTEKVATVHSQKNEAGTNEVELLN